ncbi:hypothetical protein LOZ58_006762 [Ophidiomyces ophidiicola]|nr:hypothetical protein LOZ58_006762 [Ophidiomyces ophidiicola]
MGQSYSSVLAGHDSTPSGNVSQSESSSGSNPSCPTQPQQGIGGLRYEFNLATKKLQQQEQELIQCYRKEKQNEHYFKQKLMDARNEYTEQAKHLQSENKQLKADLELLRSEREADAEKVRIAQESAFRNMGEGKWAPQEDSVVRTEMKKFEGVVRGWAKKHAHEECSVLENLSHSDIQWLNEVLKDVVKLHSFCRASLDKQTWKDKTPFLLVQAIISRYGFRHVFLRPFHFLRLYDTAHDGYVESCFAQDLHVLYGLFQRADHEVQAHSWRSQTVRLLSSSNTILPHAGHQRETACKRLACAIMNGPISRICREATREENELRSESLAGLLLDASNISAGLWTQRNNIKCLWLHDLGKFQVNSPFMSAHRLQKLDEGDTRLGGNDILAVIQPAVLAYGSNEGENYKEWRVWLKAIVIVDEYGGAAQG